MAAHVLPPSLLEHLLQSVASFPGQQHLSLQVVRSQPRRSHALFPHATNIKTKIYQEEVLVVLSQKIQVPVLAPVVEPPPTPLTAKDDSEASAPPQPEPTTSSDSATTPPAAALAGSGTQPAPASAPDASTHVETRLALVPIAAIEANLYTIPSTSTSLVYISKVDTSGLATTTISPTRTLVDSFIQYHLIHPPHATQRVRIHVFASAQAQYLFPGSAENNTKHILTDKQLLRWWKATISAAVTSPAVAGTVSATRPSPKLFYLIPGLSQLESLPYVPPPSPDAPNPTWAYGHPHKTLPSPLHPSSTPATATPLYDHIPSFPDDPKSRFLMSLTSSRTAPSGNEGDYDDVMLELASAAFTTGHASNARAAEVERARERERALLDKVEGGVDEWWELMENRQECRSGVLVGFFVVARDGVVDEAAVRKEAPRKYPASLPHRVFTALWSQFHNVDYSRPHLAKCAVAADKWREDVRRVLAIEVNAAVVPKLPAPADAPPAGTTEATDSGPAAGETGVAAVASGDEAVEALRKVTELYRAEVWRELAIDNPAYVPKKREAPAEPAKVNMLAPRKKKKVAA